MENAKSPVKNLSRDEKSDQRLVRKHNNEIGYRVKSGQISLLSRKLVNVMLYHAQKLRGKEDENGIFWIEAVQLVKDVRFNSKNYRFLIESLDEIQSVKILRPLTNGAETVGMISEVLLPLFAVRNSGNPHNVYADARKHKESNNGQVKNKSGGRLQIGFSLPVTIKEMLLNPKNNYTPLPLVYMASLQTTGGLVLYEIAKRYETSPGKRTNRAVWEWWWSVMTGANETSESPEYKYFKRDVIRPAINEINALSDISVDLVEHKEGRRIKEIQFLVESKKQSVLDLDMDPPPVDISMLARFGALGISAADAENILRKYTLEEVLATLELVEERISNKVLKPVGSPAAYLKIAFAEQYAAGAKAKKEAAVKKSTVISDAVLNEKLKHLTRVKNKAESFELPVGAALELAWSEFIIFSQNKKLFKNIGNSFSQASVREVNAFKGFLASRITV